MEHVVYMKMTCTMLSNVDTELSTVHTSTEMKP